MNARRWWLLESTSGVRPPAHDTADFIRDVDEGDSDVLAELMLDAYAGTIDDEGETIAEAIAEVAGWMQTRQTDPIAQRASVLLLREGVVASAALVNRWDADEAVFAYVITTARYKGSGLGRRVVQEALDRLAKEGITRVRGAITNGNEPSERLFAGLGFTPGPTIAD